MTRHCPRPSAPYVHIVYIGTYIATHDNGNNDDDDDDSNNNNVSGRNAHT